MAEVEILIVGSPGRNSPGASTAGLLQKHMLRLGASVRRVTSLDDDEQIVADEITAVLRRAPTLLAVIGCEHPSATSGLTTATERDLVDGVPEGAHTVCDEPLCVLMLVGPTQVSLLPESPERFEELWSDLLGDSMAEWFGAPTHVIGELMILGSEPSSLVSLISSVAREHPAVNLRIDPSKSTHGGVRVRAMASGRDDRAKGAVDAALREIERAAAAARLQVSSSGRISARVVEAE